jgi:formate dehydrogenase subunit gamma
MLTKWSGIDRLTHWLLFIGVTTAIITGLPIFEESLFGFLLPLRQVPLPPPFTIHFIGALLMIAAVLIHVVYRAASGRSSEIWFGSKDIKDFGLITRHWFGLTKNYPRLGPHHPGQKAIYWLVAVVGLLLTGGSGLIMKFRPDFAETWITTAILVHDIGFILMLTLLVGHFILAITRTNWPVLKAMFVTGKVSVSWARHHHPEWVEKTTTKAKIE